MKTTTRLMLIACLALPFLAACKKDEAPAVEAVLAPLVAPTGTESAEWDKYLTDVVTRNVEGSTSVYLYTLPSEAAPDFAGEYGRQLEKAQADVGRGGVEGTLLAFGSQNSAKSADLAVSAFEKAQAGSMKGVRVLFIGSAADNERVKASVAPSGADYKFIEAK